MYTLQIRHGHLSVVQVFILFLNFSNEFSFLKLFGTKTHIFGASETKLSLPRYTEFVFIRFNVNCLLRVGWVRVRVRVS